MTDKPGAEHVTPPVDYSAVNDHAEVMKPVEQVRAGLQTIVDEARSHATDILSLEEKLKEAKKKYKAIVEDVLPKALKAAGYGEVPFATTDGTSITVKEKVETSVPADRREDAWNWLEANGKADLIKREVTIAFMVKEGDKAKACTAELIESYGRSVDNRRWVEPATLKAAIVGMLEKQKTEENAPIVPRDLFGVREFEIAEFKAPKKK